MRGRTFKANGLLGRRGQTILEYTMIIIIILGVTIAMRDYVKRGIQGRWKSATDDFGGQYDPQFVNSQANYATQVNAQTDVQVENGSADTLNGVEFGQWTSRGDASNTLETKVGFTQVGS